MDGGQLVMPGVRSRHWTRCLEHVLEVPDDHCLVLELYSFGQSSGVAAILNQLLTLFQEEFNLLVTLILQSERDDVKLLLGSRYFD